MAERITQAELARRERVSRATVTRWIQQGRISPPGADGRLDAEQAHQERILTESPLPKHQGAKAWHAADKARRSADPSADPSAGPSAASNATTGAGHPAAAPTADPAADHTPCAPQLSAEQHDLSAALKLETWRLQKAKAEQANMALDRDAGLLVERSTVEYLLRDLGESIRAELGNFADLHTPELASVRGDSHQLHQRLSEATDAVLHRLADTLARRAAAVLPEIRSPGREPERTAATPARHEHAA